MPKVALSEAHAKLCRIKVGDTLPTLTLSDGQGKSAPLATQFGTALTVVAFVRLTDPSAVELLDDLERFVVPVFESRGVKTVGVAVGAAPNAVAEAIKKKNIRLTLLSDADGRALEQLTTDAARPGPWIYLIDKTGHVVWFDIEYSRSTRRDLQVALTLLTQSTRQARSN
jgi:peroxiredoxin